MREALAEFRTEGITTNIPVISRILSHATFTDGTYDTAFLEHLVREPTTESTGDELIAVIAVAMALDQDLAAREQPNRWKVHGRRQAMVNRLSVGGQ